MRSLYEDDDWLVVEKPSGISTHGAWDGDKGVVEWLELHKNLKLFVVSRLDKETSGPLLFAKNREASARAEKIHTEYTASKTYVFIAGAPNPDSRKPTQWVINEPIDGKKASTQFRLLKKFENARLEFPRGTGGLALYEAKISSGRKHQIRRHAALSGIPIFGDSEYGGKDFPRTCLHCTEINWPEIDTPIACPIPSSFQALDFYFSSLKKLTDVHQTDFVSSVLPALAFDRRHTLFNDISEAFRLVHRGECGADFSLDRFGPYFCAWVYEESALLSARQTADYFSNRLHLQGGVIKILFTDPHHKGALCKTEIMGISAEDFPDSFVITEHNIKYNVSLKSEEQTGFFLDQRDNRRFVYLKSKDKKVANLFSYTCSFSVTAAAGLCSEVISVDVSKSALGEGLKNLGLNGLERRGVTKIAQDDVRIWLDRQLRKSSQPDFRFFDLIICDPPTFGTNSGTSTRKKAEKKDTNTYFRIEKEWQILAEKISRLVEPTHGLVLFCTNNRGLQTEKLESSLKQYFENVVRHRTPLDFPEEIDARHNRFFWCSQPASSRE